MAFITDLVLKADKLDIGQWTVCSELVYVSRGTNIQVIRVPPGFVTDLSSVPRLPFAYLLFGGIGSEAAVLHDYLYEVHIVSRETSDSILLEAMAQTGVAWWRRYPMYFGVRLFGWLHW